MRSDRTDPYKERLLRLRCHLADAVDDGVASVAEDSDSEGDQVNPLIDEVLVEATVERSEVQLLEEVNAALDRIERGTFGRCTD